jgi:hypothetical protein
VNGCFDNNFRSGLGAMSVFFHMFVVFHSLTVDGDMFSLTGDEDVHN